MMDAASYSSLGMGVVGMCTDETALVPAKARALAGYQSVRMLEEGERRALTLISCLISMTMVSLR